MKLYTYPDEKSKCRKCSIYQYFHYGVAMDIYLSASCSSYVPSDNLDYLEYIYDKKNNVKENLRYES